MLRIAYWFATLMGLGHALQREVVGIDSLEALAMKAWSAPFQVGAAGCS